MLASELVMWSARRDGVLEWCQ